MLAKIVSGSFFIGLGLVAKGLFFTGGTKCDAPYAGYRLCQTPDPSKGQWMLIGAGLIVASFLVYAVGTWIQRRITITRMRILMEARQRRIDETPPGGR